mgnify:CR=1 FL=1
MMINFDIPDKDVKQISGDGLKTVKNIAQKYTKELIKEAKEVEKACRQNGANPEITSSMIYKAVDNLLRKADTTRRSIFCQVTSVSSASLASYTANFITYPNGIYLILFIIFLVIACVSTVITLLKH